MMMYPNQTILHPDNGPSGFATSDFQFAAIPFGKKYMIIAQGQQLEVVKTRALAEIRLEQLKNSHRKLTKGTNTPAPVKSLKKQKKTPVPSGVRGSRTTTGSVGKKPPSKPQPTKTKPTSKPSILNSNPLLDALQ
jgi:hypothetical protein